MRWPWVTRSALEEAQRRAEDAKRGEENAKAALSVALQHTSEALRQVESLTRCVVELKQSGHDLPAPVPPAPEPRPPMPGKVAKAVALRSEPNTRERRDLETRARDLVQAGLPEDEVAAMVLKGEEVEL